MRAVLALITAATFAATSVQAGGFAEPLMEPEIIQEQSATTGGFIIPLVLLAVLIAVASSGSGGGTTVSTTAKIPPIK